MAIEEYPLAMRLRDACIARGLFIGVRMTLLAPIEVEDGTIQRAMLEMAKAHCKTCSFQTKWTSVGDAMEQLARHAVIEHDAAHTFASINDDSE